MASLGSERTLSTTDATVTTAWIYTLADNTAISLVARVQAMQSDGSNRKSFMMGIQVYRDGAGALVQGVVFDFYVPYGTAGFVTAVATIDTNANDVRLRVTGIAATNINWRVYVEPVEVA